MTKTGNPDWDRFLVSAGQNVPNIPVGDPTRWGSQVETFLDPAGNNILSEQLIMVRTRDAYARSWALVGQLTLPQATWNAPGVFPAGPFPLIAALEIVQGVGQSQVKQDIILSCGNNATVGLCNTQNAVNGGPYLSTFGGPPNFDESRPFAAIGALVGNMINIRVRYIVGFPPTGLPTTAMCSALITPYAAGLGL